MDVYLVPIGHDRHELYCEVPDDPEPAEGEIGDESTFLGRLKRRVHQAIADAEREWRDRQAGKIEVPATRWGRAKAHMRAWIAEKVAEQRLLWHLRRQEQCALFHAQDTSREESLALMRGILQRDYERHRKWFAVHTTLFILSGIFFFIPGPNLVAYIFFFRLAGHYLSMKGARQGLDGVTWTPQPCRELSELRSIVAMPPRERNDRVRAIAKSLGLEHLATFFNRVAAV
jgi:hypothetical protein